MWANVIVTYTQCESTIKNIYKRIYTINVLLYARSLESDVNSHSLSFLGMMLSSYEIIPGNMVEKVNKACVIVEMVVGVLVGYVKVT